MTAPGFSVSDLIQAVGHVKTAFDAFYAKHTNSRALMRELDDEICGFKDYLEEHQRSDTLAEATYRSIQGTLDQYESFLQKYKSLLGEGYSLQTAWRTIRYAYNKDEVQRLRDAIARHRHDLDSRLNLKIWAHIRRDTIVAPTGVAAVPNEAVNPALTGTPKPASPMTPQNTIKIGSSSPSPFQRPSSQQVDRKRQSSEISPLSAPVRPDPEIPPVPPLVLPLPAITFVDVYVLTGGDPELLHANFKAKTRGNYRALVAKDERNKEVFKHTMKLADGQNCYPSTWHSKIPNHNPFEVTFIEPSKSNHSVTFQKGKTGIPVIPIYAFEKKEDFKYFQSEVHGMQLVAWFEFEELKSATSSKMGDARLDHLKIWRDRATQEHTLSFYAGLAKRPRHLEFPISMFNATVNVEEDIQTLLRFTAANESKRKASKQLSHSPTGISSIGSSVSACGSRRDTCQTDVTASSIGATTISSSTSRNSVISMESINETQLSRRNPFSDEVQATAKELKYLDITFSTGTEAQSFKKVYEQAQQDEKNWWEQQLSAAQRAASVSPALESPAIFAMSPILSPAGSPQLQQKSGSSRDGIFWTVGEGWLR